MTDAAVLVEQGDALVDGLEDGWLRDQALGLRTYAGVLAGEELSYSDEVEGCYGIRQSRAPESEFEQAHRELDAILPGDGSLEERYLVWREGDAIPAEHLADVVRAHLGPVEERLLDEAVAAFTRRQDAHDLVASDQLLNAVYLIKSRLLRRIRDEFDDLEEL